MEHDQQARIERLEKTNCALVVALAITACLALVGVLRAPVRVVAPPADPDAISDVVRTRRLEVIGSGGQTLIQATTIDEDHAVLSVGARGGVIGLEANQNQVMLYGNRKGDLDPVPNVQIGTSVDESMIQLRHGREVQEIRLPGKPDT